MEEKKEWHLGLSQNGWQRKKDEPPKLHTHTGLNVCIWDLSNIFFLIYVLLCSSWHLLLLLFFFLKKRNSEIWVGQTTLNREKKGDGLNTQKV